MGSAAGQPGSQFRDSCLTLQLEPGVEIEFRCSIGRMLP